MLDLSALDIPRPPTAIDQKRWERIARARRFMHGGWEQDIQKELKERLKTDRRQVWGKPTLSINLYRDLHSQIGGVLYDQPPEIGHADQAAAEGLLGEEGLLDRVQLWSAMQAFAEDLSAMNDHALRIHYTPEDGVTVAPVYGDRVVAESRYTSPSEPVFWAELQLHMIDGVPTWCWEQFDLRMAKTPIHRVVLADDFAFKAQGFTDVSAAALGDLAGSGEGYRYRFADGTPFIPVVLYHVRPLQLWSDGRLVELQAAALETSVLWSFWVHCVQKAVWAQRNVAGLEPIGVEIVHAGGDRKTRGVDLDPATVAEWKVSETEDERLVTPMQWQWGPAVDPEVLERAISRFIGKLSAHAGVPASDILRTESGDAQSGYAIAISNAGLRRIQRRLEPQLRRGDLQTLRRLAAVSNRFAGTTFPESGYTASYPALPKSADELVSELEDIGGKVDRGLMSRIDALMRLHPGISRQQAMDLARRIDSEQAAYGLRPTLTTPTIP